MEIDNAGVRDRRRFEGHRRQREAGMTSGSLNALDSGRCWSHGPWPGTGLARRQSLTGAVGTLKGEPDRRRYLRDTQVLGGQLIVPDALYQKAVPAAFQGRHLRLREGQAGANLVALRKELNTVVSHSWWSRCRTARIHRFAGQLGELLLRSSTPCWRCSVLIAVLASSTPWRCRCSSAPGRSVCPAIGMSRRKLRRMITIESVSTRCRGRPGRGALGWRWDRGAHGLRSQAQHAGDPYLPLLIVLIASALAGMGRRGAACLAGGSARRPQGDRGLRQDRPGGADPREGRSISAGADQPVISR